MSQAYNDDIKRIVKTLAPRLTEEIDNCAAEIRAGQVRLAELKAELAKVLELVNAEQLYDKLARPKNGKSSLKRLAKALGAE